MQALTFTLKKQPTHRLNCSVLTPNKLAGLTIAQISQLSLTTHENYAQVADYFDVYFEGSHTGDASKIIFAGDCTKLDFIGAGMQKGTIICQGNVGDRLGDSMRRGLILVDGNAGDYAASRMVAGTIGVFGKVGQYAGFGMKRGTLLLTQTPHLSATFTDCGSHHLAFLRLMLANLRTLPTQFAALDNTRVRRYCGDIANNGKAEILVFEAENQTS